jgi:hypothetical protein
MTQNGGRFDVRGLHRPGGHCKRGGGGAPQLRTECGQKSGSVGAMPKQAQVLIAARFGGLTMEFSL